LPFNFRNGTTHHLILETEQNAIRFQKGCLINYSYYHYEYGFMCGVSTDNVYDNRIY